MSERGNPSTSEQVGRCNTPGTMVELLRLVPSDSWSVTLQRFPVAAFERSYNR